MKWIVCHASLCPSCRAAYFAAEGRRKMENIKVTFKLARYPARHHDRRHLYAAGARGSGSGYPVGRGIAHGVRQDNSDCGPGLGKGSRHGEGGRRRRGKCRVNIERDGADRLGSEDGRRPDAERVGRDRGAERVRAGDSERVGCPRSARSGHAE